MRKNFVEAFYSIISKFLSKYIVKTSLTPNQITIISGTFGIIGAFLLILQSKTGLICAGISIQLFIILDLVDGDIARMKSMQSLFGKWLDIFFDKLNDFLIIIGLSVGVYKRTQNITALYLGLIVMGLIFFIQFLMVSNSIIFKDEVNSKTSFGKRRESDNSKPKRMLLLNNIRQVIGKHFLMEHCTFLLIVSIFAVLYKTYLCLWLLAFHSFLTFVYIFIHNIYKLKRV